MSLTLKIFNQQNNPVAVPDESKKVFEAQELSWSKIVSIWDECVDIYPNYLYTISDETSNDPMKNIVTSSQISTFQELAASQGDVYVCDMTWKFGGSEGDLTISASEMETEKSSHPIMIQKFTDMINAKFEYNSTNSKIQLKSSESATFNQLFTYVYESYSDYLKTSST